MSGHVTEAEIAEVLPPTRPLPERTEAAMNSPDDHNKHQRPSEQDASDEYRSACEEPVVDVPAGLLGQAIELLDLCDELFNRPGSRHLDAHVGAVINRYQRTGVATLRWFHNGLGITATDLQELLDDRGIIVEPTLRGRPLPHHR